MIPLMTRRSSTRCKPRERGKNGSRRRIWTRDSKTRSDMQHLRPTQNHTFPSRVKGPDLSLGRLLARYLGALHDLPANLLALAIKRSTAAHRHHTLPLPGDIRATVSEELARRRLALLRLQTAARFSTFRDPVPEHERLTLSQLTYVRDAIAGGVSLRTEAVADPSDLQEPARA